MREFEIDCDLKKILKKLIRKDRVRYEIIMKKIYELLNCENVNHYKNLRKPLQHLKRVHIDSHFVLTFRYIEKEDTIIFYDFSLN